MPLQQQQQLQQQKTRGRALAFWQRQAEEEVVVRVGREGGEGGICVGGGGHLCEWLVAVVVGLDFMLLLLLMGSSSTDRHI